MILQDAARRGTGLARLIGLAWALGLANVAPATAQTQMQTPTQAQPASALPAIPAPAPSGALEPRDIRAQLAPRQYTTLAAEIGAKVQRLAVTEGGAFKKDQLLVQFDCSLQQAQLNKAHAGQNAADKTWRANQRLAQLNSVGKVELETSQAEVQKAAAEVAASKALLDKCRVTAPYAGRVAEQKIREQQYAQPGQPLLDIIDDTALELEFLVPSRWLVWLAGRGVPGAHRRNRQDLSRQGAMAGRPGRPGEPVHQGERRHRRAFRRPDRRHERTGADGTAAGPLTRPAAGPLRIPARQDIP